MSSATPQSVSMPLEAQLEQFGQLAAEALDELMMLTISGGAEQENAEAAVQLLQSYGELVQRIGQLAWDCELQGLQAVCSMIETNLLLLQGENRALSAEEHALLAGWPMLLYGYMSGKADSESSTALIQNLSANWPITLTGEAAEEELARLTGQSAEKSDIEVPGDTDTQHVEREMLSILAVELEQMGDQFSIEQALDTLGTAEQRQVILETYGGFLERLQFTAESVGLTALGAFIAQLHKQISALSTGLSAAQLTKLQQLPERLAFYLANPLDEDAAGLLAELLADAAWPMPLEREKTAAWQSELNNVQVSDSMPHTVERASRAEHEDVSLALPDDVNADLLEGLLQELPVQVAAFTAAIAHITGGHGNLKDAEQAMRAAHTLKGAANTVGVHGIANLTHHLEDILVALIDAGKMPQRELADVLIHAGDCLESMSEFLQGIGPLPEHAREVLQEVLDQANRIDHEGVDSAAMELENTELAVPLETPAEQLDAEAKADVPPPVVEQTLRVPAPVVDELLRLAGETLISNSQIQEYLSQSVAQAAVIRKQQQLIHQLVAELEDMVDIRGVNSPAQGVAHKGNDFDALEFEHYSELHTISRRLIEATTDAQEMAGVVEGQLASLDDLLEEQRRLQMANQHAVMRTRMVAVSSVVSRLQRGVRQTGRLLDKTVELTIKGENTTVDSHVLNDLMDPLMHILRNAVDHGIEAPEVRVAAGKTPHGHIELSFAREGNSIVVRCRDDGAGLDYASIRRIAENKGMLKPEHEHTEDELARLVLAPGFSTREEASQVSGRGVGMDVVYSRIQAMKGMLALNSHTGQGLSVELRLPAALLATHTLIVRQRDRRLAISSRGVEDIRYATRDQIVEIGSRPFYREGEKVYALVRLEELLTMAYDRRIKDREGFTVMLTRQDDGTVTAVQVQEIIDSREVVMKKFGHYVPRTQGVIGAVILGDGGVAPVIDLVDLLHVPMTRSALAGHEMLAAYPDETYVANNSKRALVVDDSLSARRALVQVMKDAGYEVRTANDGLDAVNMLEKFAPDIIISDMEMPRMSGLELTANVRRSERTKHIPVIMITSRSTEKHRQMSTAAGVDVHMVKPFNDETLLQHVSRLTQR